MIVVSVFILNLMRQHSFNRLRKEQLNDPKSPVWNLPQVNRFICNRWEYHDCLWKGHSRQAQSFTSKGGERFTTLWTHKCIKDVTAWAQENFNKCCCAAGIVTKLNVLKKCCETFWHKNTPEFNKHLVLKLHLLMNCSSLSGPSLSLFGVTWGQMKRHQIKCTAVWMNSFSVLS